MIKIAGNLAIKCIKYLQKNRIEFLQDKEGNLINITPISNEIIKCWQNKPIEIIYKGKEAIYYKNNNYILEEDLNDSKENV